MIATAHPSDDDAKAQHESAIHFLYGEEQAINPQYDTLGEKKSRRRVAIGGHLFRLRPVIKRLGLNWTAYLDSGVLPFSRRTAYDYIDECYLQTHGEGYDFAKLAKMRTNEIRTEAHQLRGTLHDDRIADRLKAQREAHTRQLAALVIRSLDDADLYDAGQLICDGWVPAIFEEHMLDAVTRPVE